MKYVKKAYIREAYHRLCQKHRRSVARCQRVTHRLMKLIRRQNSVLVETAKQCTRQQLYIAELERQLAIFKTESIQP